MIDFPKEMWRLLTSSRDDRGARAARRSLEISFFHQDAISGLVGDARKKGEVSVASNAFDTMVGSRMSSPCTCGPPGRIFLWFLFLISCHSRILFLNSRIFPIWLAVP